LAFDNPHGFTLLTPIDHVMKIRCLVTSGQVIRIGDAVKQGATTGTVTRAGAGEALIGVATGYGDDSGSSGTVYVDVVIDPAAQFYAQVGTGFTVAATDVFSGIDLTDAAGSGLHSAQEADGNAIATTSGQFIILDIVKGAEPGGGTKPTWATALSEIVVSMNVQEMTLRQIHA